MFKLIGAAGLLLIIVGIVVKQRSTRNIIYIGGGILLEIYSIYIGDYIFITLQAVFMLVAVYDLIRQQRTSNK